MRIFIAFFLLGCPVLAQSDNHEESQKVYRGIQEKYPLFWALQQSQGHPDGLKSKVRPPVQVQARPPPPPQPKKPGFWARFASAAAKTADAISQGYALQAEQNLQAEEARRVRMQELREELRMRRLEEKVRRLEKGSYLNPQGSYLNP